MLWEIAWCGVIIENDSDPVFISPMPALGKKAEKEYCIFFGSCHCSACLYSQNQGSLWRLCWADLVGYLQVLSKFSRDRVHLPEQCFFYFQFPAWLREDGSSRRLRRRKGDTDGWEIDPCQNFSESFLLLQILSPRKDVIEHSHSQSWVLRLLCHEMPTSVMFTTC